MSLEFDRRGAGPPLVLIHPLGADGTVWEPVLDALAEAFDVIVPDLPGFGWSERPGRPLYSVAVAGLWAELMSALGYERFGAAGGDLGSHVSRYLALDHPDRVASVTFLATTTSDDALPGPTPEFLAAVGTEAPGPDDRAAWVEHLVGVIRAYHGTSPLFDEVHVRRHVEVEVARARDLAAAANHFMIDTPGPERGGFGDIARPALVVHGELDPVFPLPHAFALRDAVPGARLLVLEGAGHELPPARWDEFTAVLLAHTAPTGAP